MSKSRSKSKQAAKKQSKKGVVSKPANHSKGSREEDYLESLDLRTWWEEFCNDTNDNGTVAHKTVWQFIQKKSKIQWQRDFLYWILGPTVEKDAASPYKSFKQFDWLERRKHGHWYSSQNLETLHRTLKSKETAFAKIAELGNPVVDFITRIKSLASQIDEEFSAGIFLPGNSRKENAIRAKLYMDLNQSLLNQLEQANHLYGRTQGVEMQRLNEFLAMFSNGMGQAAGIGQSLGLFQSNEVADDQKGIRSVSAKLIDMVTAKAVNYNLDLPTKEMEETITNSRPRVVKKG